MDIAFVAQTRVCTFLLDAEGICRWTIPRPEASDREREAAELCLGAQYVASLDRDAEGLLVKDPTQGKNLLFARVGDDGRIRLVRSGPLLELRVTTEDEVPLSAERPTPPAPTQRDLDDDYGTDSVKTLIATKPLESEPVTLRLVTPFDDDDQTARSSPVPLVVRRGLLPRRTNKIA